MVATESALDLIAAPSLAGRMAKGSELLAADGGTSGVLGKPALGRGERRDVEENKASNATWNVR